MPIFLVVSRSQSDGRYEIDSRFSCRGEAERRVVSLLSLRTLQTIGAAFVVDLDESATYLAIIHTRNGEYSRCEFWKTIPSEWKVTDGTDRFESEESYAVIIELR